MKSKLNKLYLSSMASHYDVIILTETWLNSTVFDNEIFSDDYLVYRCDRNNLNCPGKQEGGGVLIAVKSKFRSSRLNSSFDEHIEHVCVSLYTQTNRIILFGSYIPPCSDKMVYNTHVNSITEITASLNGDNVNNLVFGDFNLPRLTWMKCDDVENYLIPINVTSEVESCLVDNLMMESLMEVNHIINDHGNLLDLIFTDMFDRVSIRLAEFYLLPPQFRYHPAIEILVKIDNQVAVIESNEYYYDFKNSNFSLLDEKLRLIDWKFEEYLDLNCAIDYFYKIIFQCIEETTPRKRKYYSNRSPWFNADLARLRNQRNRAAHNNRELFCHLRSEFNALNSLSYKLYIENLQINIKNDPKQFWNFINAKKKSNGYPTIMNLNDTCSTSPQEIANLFANYFKSVYKKDDNIDWTSFDETYFPDFDIKSFSISESDMLNALNNVNQNTGAGPDRLPAIFLKNCANSLCWPLAKLFNWSLDSGVFPHMWKHSFVKPIYKSGKRNEISNYRGIAKLSAIPKLFEKIVCEQIYEQSSTFIFENQHGFIKGKSTSTNLLEYTSHIINQMENGFQIDSVYTDFSKAFDKVSHQIMTYKLQRYGFDFKIVKWITRISSIDFKL